MVVTSLRCLVLRWLVVWGFAPRGGTGVVPAMVMVNLPWVLVWKWKGIGHAN
jgi:hypothetical protein